MLTFVSKTKERLFKFSRTLSIKQYDTIMMMTGERRSSHGGETAYFCHCELAKQSHKDRKHKLFFKIIEIRLPEFISGPRTK